MKIYNQPCVHCWELHIDHIAVHGGATKCLFGPTTFQGVSHTELSKILVKLGYSKLTQNRYVESVEFEKPKVFSHWIMRIRQRNMVGPTLTARAEVERAGREVT